MSAFSRSSSVATPSRRRRSLMRFVAAGVAAVVAGGGAVPVTEPAAAAQAADEWNPESSYTTTDTGDGTYTVPMLNADVPDVSVERVPASQNDEGRDIYYMVSTTMHLSPGAPIMKSYDLVNWEIVNYAFDRLDISDAASLAERLELLRAGAVGVVDPLPRRHLLRAHQFAEPRRRLPLPHR